MQRFKTVAAVTITSVFATFSLVEASPPSTDPPADTQEDSTSTGPTTTVAVTVEASPPSGTEPASSAPEGDTEATTPTMQVDVGTTVELNATTTAAPTSNPNQVNQDQAVVITGTVVSGADTGSNTEVDEQPDQGGSQQPAEVDTGNATAVGSTDENAVTQGADVLLTDSAKANIVQVALILNVGMALANSGLNVVGSSPGGSGTSGAIGTGNASATGLDIDQYITQAARENGDEDTDAHASQVAISLWMGLATANSGTNAVTGTEVTGTGGAVSSGDASATGNDSVTEIGQYAEILGMDDSTINVTQQATVLNLGFALANSGLNEFSGVAGGLLTASDADDDAMATQLFAMLLPALLQSYGYGPAQGSITTGDATAVGNESQTFISQVAMAAASGDGVVDIVQEVLVANMGAAGANTGGNTLGSVRTLDPETASAVVTMAAFMSELLTIVHRSANDTTLSATSQGIEIPFQGLILRLDGFVEGLDTQVSQDGVQANIRQVSIVVSLGVSNANTGGNITSSETQHGTSVNSLQAGDAIAVLALDENGNVVTTGDAVAANDQVVVICQRINADDIDCLAPPEPPEPPEPPVTTPTTPTTPTTTTPTTPTIAPPVTTPASSPISSADGAGPSVLGDSPTATIMPTQAPSGVGRIPSGTLPATGGETVVLLAIGMITVLAGGAILVATRRRICE